MTIVLMAHRDVIIDWTSKWNGETGLRTKCSAWP